MKVTKIREANWYVHKKLIEEGKMISLNGKRKDEPEYHKKFRQEFKNLDLYLDMDEMEDLVYYLNKEVKLDDNDRDFEVPCDSTKEYLIVFNDKIIIYLCMIDEYMGMGDSTTYGHLESILVPEDTSIEEVKKVKEWLVKGGFKENE